MLKWESECGLFSDVQLKKYQRDLFYSDDGNGMISVKSHKGLSNAKQNINLDGLTAQYVTNTIISETDRQIARQRIQKLKTEGMTLRERIAKINRRLTAGKMVLDLRKYHLDDSILYCVRKSVDEKKDMELSKARCEALQYMKNCYTTDEVFKKHGNEDVGGWNS